MTPTNKQPDAPRSYREAIGQLLAAAQRTHDPQTWITLTTLAGMFERLDQEHQAHGGNESYDDNESYDGDEDPANPQA